MKTISTPLKTLAIILMVSFFGKLYAQDDLVAVNESNWSQFSNEIAASSAPAEKVRISDFAPNLKLNTAIIRLKSANNIPMRVNFYDCRGELAMEQFLNLNSGSNEFSIDMSQLPKGTYIVQFYSNEGSAIRKITKSNE